MRALIAALVVIAVVAVAVVVTHDGRPRVDVAASLPAPRGESGGHRFPVTVPWGTLRVQVGPVRDAVDRAAGDSKQVRAPADGRFVYVSTEPETDTLLPLARRPGVIPDDPDLVLVTGGRTYPLPRLGGQRSGNGQVVGVERAQWVAVHGDASDVRLRVGYDGRTETLDPEHPRATGDFAALRGVARAAKIDQPKIQCDDRTHVLPPRCQVTRVDRAPYVGGLGWAAPGREWLIVLADADGETGPTHRDSPPRYTLDGRAPKLAYAVNDLPDAALKDPENSDQAVFDVPRGATGQTFRAAVTGARWSVELPR